MRRAFLAAVLAALFIAGCVDDGAESTDPAPGSNASANDSGQAGYDTTGCTGDHVGSGTGDITSDRACNVTSPSPSGSIEAPTGPTY